MHGAGDWFAAGTRKLKFTGIFILVSFLLLVVSFWNRNALPGNTQFVSAILSEPDQTRTREKSFDVTFNELQYTVDPEFDYDIVGMIVSYRHHDNNSRMHRLSEDHLNMIDVCVVWGENTRTAQLHKLDFWNGIFTCNVQTRDQAAWESFDMNQLSNNHLISDDPIIRDEVENVRVGDQIRVRGHLASYVNPQGGRRGTSTTRTDTGDGACETIYVRSFEIIKAATSYWRITMYGSLVALLAGLFLYFRRPYRPY